MAGLRYTASFESVSVSAAVDLLELLTPAGKVITLQRLEVTSMHTAYEPLRLALLLRTTAGTGGTALTPRADPGNTIASAVTVNRTVTTPGTAGNILNQWSGWGQVFPFDYVLGKSELEIEIPTSTRVALALLNAPGGARNLGASITWIER